VYPVSFSGKLSPRNFMRLLFLIWKFCKIDEEGYYYKIVICIHIQNDGKELTGETINPKTNRCVRVTLL